MHMNRLIKLFLVVFLASISTSVGIAREEHEEGRREGDPEISGQVVNNGYAKECGVCHLAYQPQLLPKRSWVKIMNTLDNHFGENASLDEAARTQILSYVVGNSAETSRSEASRKILSSINDTDTPLRISDTPYYKRKHRKIQPDVFKRKSILSPSNCAGCHPSAEKGDYNEHKVKIPKN
jgi:Dihaem cytochrome c